MSLVLNGTTGITSPGGDSAAVSVTTPLVTNAGTLALSATGANIVTASTNGSERMRIDSSGNLLVGKTSTAAGAGIELRPDGQIVAYRSNNRVAYFDRLTSDGSIIDFIKDGSAVGAIGSASGGIYFGSGSSGTERARIDSSGNLLVGTTNTTFSSGGIRLYENNSLEVVRNGNNTQANVYLNKPNFNGEIISFHRSGTQVGVVSVTTTATSYVTSSDYRLKHDIQPMTGALAKVAQLKPVTYKWNADDSQSQGFIAHELQEVVPECVTGEKDAVEIVEVKDENGEVIGTEERPVYQGIDTSFLVATLTAALQEAVAEINSLKARVEALEGAQA